MVKTLLAMQETWFDPWVGKIPWRGMTTLSCILAWIIPRTEEPWRATVHGVAKSWMQRSNEHFTSADKRTSCIIITAKSIRMVPLKKLVLLKKIPVSRSVIIRISNTW